MLRWPGLLLALLLQAQAVGSEGEGRGYLTFYLDNDLFAGTDRNYTNGVRLSWISEGEPLFNFAPAKGFLEDLISEPDWLARFGLLSGFNPDKVQEGKLEFNYGLSLTQLMFTPEDFESPTQPIGERRYAGWLGLGFSVHARDEKAINSAEIILGTTGSWSLAKEAQDLIHDIRDIERFEGWGDQIPNEITLDFSFLQKRRATFLPDGPRGLRADGLFEWGTRLGTFRTGARLGGFFRLGFNLPADFSDPRLSALAYSHRYFGSDKGRGRDWSAYLLFGLTGNAILHDATLDGPLFRSFDTGNTREPWVGDLFAGFGLRWRIVEFSYVHTWRSREFKEKASGGFDFGSLAIRVQL